MEFSLLQRASCFEEPNGSISGRFCSGLVGIVSPNDGKLIALDQHSMAKTPRIFDRQGIFLN
jgi:hypothetical protein